MSLNYREEQTYPNRNDISLTTGRSNEKKPSDFIRSPDEKRGAEIPQFIAHAPAPEYYEDEKAIRVWSPNNNIPNHVLDQYLSKAKEKFFYTPEQALGMLSWHKFDLNRAYADLPNFVPYPNEWSVEDKVLFEQAYQFHEKNFHKIKQMLPDKSMANLINYYYSWKKNRTKASLMEKQTRRFAARNPADSNNPSSDEDDDNNSEDRRNRPNSADDEEGADGIRRSQDNNTDRENGRESQPNDKKDCPCEERGVEEHDINCCICNKELRVHGTNIRVIIDGVVDSFCSQCYIDWKASGKKVVSERELGDCFYHPNGEPKRILFSYGDVLHLVEGIPETGDIMLKHMESQVQDVKRNIQIKKQNLCQIEAKIQPIEEQIAELDMDKIFNALPDYRPCKEWAHDEIQFVIQGLRRYGMDFSAISDVVRTKSPESIKVFYITQKERLGLESLIEEFERKKEAARIEAQVQ